MCSLNSWRPTAWLGMSDSNCRIRPRATQLDLRDNFARGRRKSGGGDPSCASCATTVWPLRLGSVFGRILVRDPIHDAVSEGDAIDGLGKTPIIDQVDKPCLTQTAGQCVVEILD
jgi:hypothetical protein